ncbi:MAG: cell division protein ZapE [Lysobacterales bacterium]
MPANPLSIYQSRVSSGDFKPDPAQQQAIGLLDNLWQDLVSPPKTSFWNIFKRQKSKQLRGVYLWGGVGRGKTWLMDLFFDSIPFEQKQRIHFHRFMARVHEGLREHHASSDPLKVIARDWGNRVQVLCFDEFFVSDIADAMLLAILLEALLEHGVILVATSNLHPDDLYKDGLQRARFLPAIELIKAHTHIFQVDGEIDYRLRILEKSAIYHFPTGESSESALQTSFDDMAAGCEMNSALKINQRMFDAKCRGDGIIWFSFEELCEKPRSTNDYIEISRSFNTVLLSALPLLNETSSDATRRFINLVDEFYDRNVKLLISAAAPIEEIYSGTRLAFEFQRTISRINEMQSHQYLAKPHLP